MDIVDETWEVMHDLWKKKEIEKLLQLLGTMPFPLFCEVLDLSTQEQLRLFKQEALTEPVQHQLTLLHHNVDKRLEFLIKNIEKVEQDIEEMNVLEQSTDDIQSFYQSFHAIKQNYIELEGLLEKALSVAWNTNRLDLIEKLSNLREKIQRTLLKVIGRPVSSGLYQKLEQKLISVFGINGDNEQLQDDDHAIEGIAKLGICYIPDYIEVGLLPSQEKLLKKEHSEQLYEGAKINLENAGLKSVKDLKRARIFSKKMLQELLKAPTKEKKTRKSKHN